MRRNIIFLPKGLFDEITDFGKGTFIKVDIIPAFQMVVQLLICIHAQVRG